MRCEVFQSDVVRVARFAFQACSFSHSDISPFRIKGLRAVSKRLSHTPTTFEEVSEPVCIQEFDAHDRGRVRELCQTP